MEPGEEITAENRPGADTRDPPASAEADQLKERRRQSLFELNGQPRVVRVAATAWSIANDRAQRPEGRESANVQSTSAANRWPGVVALCPGRPVGQKVKSGDLLPHPSKPMKMETGIQCEDP